MMLPSALAQLLVGISLIGASLFGLEAQASGLDVQLKDLRGSYYYIAGAKECTKLVASEVKKYGRLTHCDPEEDHVMCKAKGGEKLFAFEQQAACEASLKKGIEPTPAE